MDNPIAEVLDVFFNGRPARREPKTVTIRELIKRKDSHVLVDGKLYRVVVTEARAPEPR